jgi:MFS family permease
MAIFTRMFLLLFVVAGLFVLGRLFILHTSPAFSEGWLAQFILGLLFTLIGSIFFYIENNFIRRYQKGKTLLNAHPQQPWLAREDWRQGYAESESAVMSYGYMMMGLFGTMILLPFIGKMISAVQHGHWQVLIMVLFPLVGIGFLAASVVGFLRFKRYGQSRFEFTPPISLGSRLMGKITMKGLALLNQPATVQVSCRYVQNVSVGPTSSTVYNKTYRVLWQGSCTSTARPDTHGVALPVDIPLPYDLQESSGDNSRTTFIEWVMEAASQVPGVDFSGVYSIPVYRTEKSNPALTQVNLHILEGKSNKTIIPGQFKSFSAQQTASGLQVTTRRGVGWVNALAGIVTSLVLAGIIIFLAINVVTLSRMSSSVGGILLLVFSLLPLMLFGYSIPAFFKKTTLTFGQHALDVKTSGLISSSRQYPYSAINSVDVDTTTANTNAPMYFLILNLNLAAGQSKSKKILFFPRKEETDWLAEQLEDRLPNARSRR